MTMQLLHLLRGDFADDLSRCLVRHHDCKMLIAGSIGRERNICLHRIELAVIGANV
jgi:hypothetical protein